MIFLETDRLILRTVKEEDAEIMFDYRNNPICARYQRGQTKDLPGIQLLIQSHKADVMGVDAPFLVTVEGKLTGEMVGEIVVMPEDGTISMGYTVSYRHHRRGYGYEALSVLIGYLHENYPQWDFISFTESENIASRKLLEKLGYENLGYISGMESQVYGKWISHATREEIMQAAENSDS